MLACTILLPPVLKERIFVSCVAAFIAWSSPSGAVLGDGVGGCDVELNISGGGEGSDCIFYFSFKALSVKARGLLQFLFLTGSLM